MCFPCMQLTNQRHCKNEVFILIVGIKRTDDLDYFLEDLEEAEESSLLTPRSSQATARMCPLTTVRRNSSEALTSFLGSLLTVV